MPPVSPKPVAFCQSMASSRSRARMMPRTGPKHSWVWNQEPGRTLSRMPGRQNSPSSSSCSGSTSQRSPSSSWVRPRSSFSPGASISPFIVVAGSVPGPTTRVSVASTSWPIRRSEGPSEPTTMAREAAEHFCPEWPKAECTRSSTARSGSANGVMTSAFLPDVSACSTTSGRQERNSAAVSLAPVRITWSMSAWLIRCRPVSSSGTMTSCTRSGSSPAAASPVRTASTSTAAHRVTCGAGLTTTAEPAASAAVMPPTGMATGKFHGGTTRVSVRGWNSACGPASRRAECA